MDRAYKTNGMDKTKTISMTVYERNGYCPTCDSQTVFVSYHEWLRDYYICVKCRCVPRERALHHVLSQYFPAWFQGRVHEGSPSNKRIEKKVHDYSASQYFPDKPLGIQVEHFRNENLEQLTFSDQLFDFFVTLDVLEHVFDPQRAVREMYRVVRRGGAVAFTTPVHMNLKQTRCRAALQPDNSVVHYLTPAYHGNPIGDGQSLVTWDYGQDYLETLKSWTQGEVIHCNQVQVEYGIEGEYLDVFLIRK